MSASINLVPNAIKSFRKPTKKTLSSEPVSDSKACCVCSLEGNVQPPYDLEKIILPRVGEDAGSQVLSPDEDFSQQISASLAYGIILLNGKPLVEKKEKSVAENFREACKKESAQQNVIDFLIRVLRVGGLYNPASVFIIQALDSSYAPRGNPSIKVELKFQEDGSVILVNTYSCPYVRYAEIHKENPEITRVNVRMAHNIKMGENGIPEISLVGRGFDVEGTNEQDLNTIGILLAAELKVSFKADPAKLNPESLIFLYESGNESVELLEQIRASSAVDENGKTILHYAVQNGRVESLDLVKDLIKILSININVQDKEGKTALHYAIESGCYELVDALLAAGADVNLIAKRGKTVLHYAAELGNPKIIARLCLADADLTSQDSSKMTSLHIAAQFGKVGAVQFLIGAGVDININDEDDKTALHYAIESGDIQTIKALLETGIDIDAVDFFGSTPLYYAVSANSVEAVKLLIQKGVNTQLNCRGNTILNYAIATKECNLEIVAILTNEQSVNAKNTDGESPLHCAIKAGNIEAINLLVEAGADLSALDSQSKTPLHCAAESGTIEVVEMLIKSGAVLDCVDSKGKTPLYYAVQAKNAEMVKFLIENKANIELTYNGQSILECANQAENNAEVIRLLAPVILENVDCETIEGNSKGDIRCIAIIPEFKSQFHVDIRRRATVITIRTKESSEILSARLKLSHTTVDAEIAKETETVKTFFTERKMPEILAESICQTYTQGGVQDTLEANIRESLAATDLENAFTTGEHIGLPVEVSHVIEILDGARVRLIENISFVVFRAEPTKVEEVTRLVSQKQSTDHLVTRITAQCSVILSAPEKKTKYTIEKVKLNVSGADEKSLRERIIDGFYSKEGSFQLVRNGDIDSIKKAIQGKDLNKDNINETDHSGKTLLHHAAKNGHLEIVALLLAMGADYNVKAHDKKTAETYLSTYANTDSDMFKILETLKDPSKAENINLQDSQGRTALHYAALVGNGELVAQLLAKNANLELKDNKERTPLHYAAMAKDAQVSNKLISALVNAQKESALVAKDADGKTPLHYAAETGNFDVIRALVLSKSSLNETDIDKKTALHYAAMKNHVEVVKKLLEFGSAVNLQDINKKTALHYAVQSNNIDKKTALHYAAMKNHVEVVKKLLEFGSAVNLQDINKKTALHYAVQSNNVELITSLLKAGANLLLTDSDGKTPLHHAAEGQSAEVVSLLLNNGADINRLSDEDVIFNGKTRKAVRRTALQYAARTNSLEVIETILPFSPDLNLQSSEGKTALHYAATRTNADALKTIIKAGADVCCKDGNGRGVLHYAAEVGNVEAVNFLVDGYPATCFLDDDKRTVLYHAFKPEIVQVLAAKIDINHKDKNGQTALHFFIKERRTEALKALLKVSGLRLSARDNNNKTVLHYAVEMKNKEYVFLLLEAGINADSKDNAGKTTLHYAVENGNAELAKILIEAHVSVDLEDAQGRTPIYYANKPELLDILLNAGANIEHKDKAGKTILHAAVNNGNIALVKALVQKVDINERDNEHKMALHYAVEAGNIEMVRELIAAGANIHSLDRNHKDALDYANERGHTEIASLIKELKEKTRLCEVVENGNVDAAVKMILDVDANGKTALHHAAISYAKAVEEFNKEATATESAKRRDAVVKAEQFILSLIDAGTNVTVKDNSQKRALNYLPRETNTPRTYLYILAGVKAYIQHLEKSGTSPERLTKAKALLQALTKKGSSLFDRLEQFNVCYQQSKAAFESTGTFTGTFSRLSSRFKRAPSRWFSRLFSDKRQDVITPLGHQTHAEKFIAYIEFSLKALDTIIDNHHKEKSNIEQKKQKQETAKAFAQAFAQEFLSAQLEAGHCKDLPVGSNVDKQEVKAQAKRKDGFTESDDESEGVDSGDIDSDDPLSLVLKEDEEIQKELRKTGFFAQLSPYGQPAAPVVEPLTYRPLTKTVSTKGG